MREKCPKSNNYNKKIISKSVAFGVGRNCSMRDRARHDRHIVDDDHTYTLRRFGGASAIGVVGVDCVCAWFVKRFTICRKKRGRLSTIYKYMWIRMSVAWYSVLTLNPGFQCSYFAYFFSFFRLFLSLTQIPL